MDTKALYALWQEKAADDPDLQAELCRIQGDEDEIFERFYRELSFGTAGLRGVLGAGVNRMNIYVIRRATQGLANHLKKKCAHQPVVAISYDSRIKSDWFAKEAARVLSGNGIQVHLYGEMMPVPCLSYATRELHCDAGIMVTASHNPAKYNGYKVYGSDGGQLTEEDADAVLAQINALDYFSGISLSDFDAALENGSVAYVSEGVIDGFMKAVLAQQQNPGLCATAGLKLVYSPLNGAGNKPVRRILAAIGASDVTVVPEQENPDGNFPTCPYPNPEIKETLSLGLELAEKIGADLMLATDPDCDRVGIAVLHEGTYQLLTGNHVGALLLDYICRSRTAKGTMPKNAFAVKTIVSTKLADAIGAGYGVEIKNVLTGFKYIGEQIAIVEEAGEIQRFLFGFEESYGYLCGTHARDKDAVVGSMLIVEMASYYKKEGKTLLDALNDLYAKHGVYLEQVSSFSFEGAAGMKRMDEIMESLRKNPPTVLDGSPVAAYCDYSVSELRDSKGGVEPIPLPKSNVLEYRLENGSTAIVRPSGTEPKIKLYLSAVGKDMDLAKATANGLETEMKAKMGV